MNKKKIISYGVMIIVIYATIGVIINTNEMFPKDNCEGIEDFYTGNGFIEDFLDMKVIYEENYDTSNYIHFKYGFLMADKAFAPKNLGYKKYIDCEDFSNFVICLSKKYSILCKRYGKYNLDLKYGGGVDIKDSSHVGVRCYLPWKRYKNGTVEYMWEELS